MNDVNELLDSITPGTVKGVDTVLPTSPEIDLSWVLKIPAIILLVSNIFFSIILFLRIRILDDTVTTPQSKLVKNLLVIYLMTTVVGTLVAILFFIFA